ncbi:hypothetical protein BXP70_14155 [Hymenobacter crusticola]|uniref:TonB-dependent receptor plug domain-containing protein n=2 Tax=Hymenobacter crusticola TaxID=1770526 RepID=A0A243WDN2_9BACT|nr:hypothetical protein BXP70_14155 [Hymenobacter crusticola]
MTPTAHGRHCAACAKVVVDFTKFTDAELLVWLHQQAGQPTCGRFRTDQLKRELRPTVAPRPRSWRAWLAAAVAVWGLREGAANPSKAQTSTEQRQRQGEPISIADYVQQPVVIRGIVTDSASHEALPAVTVLLAGTNLGVATNATGQFELTIPADIWAASTKHLAVSYIGFVRKDIPISASTTQLLHIAMAADVTGLMRTVTVGGVAIVNTPQPWHSPRGIWQRLKRPFHR